jgi:hypothetical protein
MTLPLESILTNLQSRNHDQKTLEEIREIIGSLQGILNDGPGALIKGLASGKIDSGHLLGLPMNIIPNKKGEGSCQPTLLVLSSGFKGKDSIWTRLTEANNRLVECYPTTKIVLFVCDCWEAKKFETDHRATFEAWAGRGVTTIFLTQPWRKGVCSVLGAI